MVSIHMPDSSQPRALQQMPGRRIIAGTFLFAALGTIAYWVTWFTNRDLLASAQTIQYYTFENAFPAADGWLALSAILATIGLLRSKHWGIYWAIVAASSGIFLGCMDVLFDLENGIYQLQGDPSGVIVEMIINILTFSLATAELIWAWYACKHSMAH